MTTPDAPCQVRIGDNLLILPEYSEGSFDLVITSPPYGTLRAKHYGGPKPDDYVDWFLPRAREFHRVLKSTGSFILNIGRLTEEGEEHPYVFDLVLSLKREVGFFWAWTYFWTKPDAMPGNFGKRAKPSTEYVFHLTRGPGYFWDDSELRIPYSSRRHLGRPKSGLRNPNGADRDFYRAGGALPPDYFNWPSAHARDGASEHPAVFPVGLPGWFIRACCPPGGIVLDPFAGSGTTAVAALALRRRAVLIEENPRYEPLIHRRLSGAGDPAIAARLGLSNDAARGHRR